MTYLQFLLGISIAHVPLQNHSPEGGIVKVIDMACAAGQLSGI